MLLPQISQRALGVRPIDWTGLDRRYMNEGELEVLIALVRSVAPATVVEIGVNRGRTAKAMLANVPTIRRYVGVDVLPGYVPAKRVQRNEIPTRPGELAAGDPRFGLILRQRGSLDLTPADLLGVWFDNQFVDAMFIDGDHGAEAVTHDTRLAWACVRPGGIVAWHDYHDRGTVDVREVLEGFYRAGVRRFWHVEDTWIVFERR